MGERVPAENEPLDLEQLMRQRAREQGGAQPAGDEPPVPRVDLAAARAIRQVQVLGGAKFRAETRVGDGGPDIETRLTLEGLSLVFDNLAQQVQVDGPGQMLVEDYRPERKPAAANPAAATQAQQQAEGTPLEFSGRGATLFTWKGHLLLDLLGGDLLLAEAVQMVHRPQGRDKPVQLDCRKLLARLESGGGMGAWMSAEGPRPVLQSVTADRDVRILSDGRAITTDLIRYTAADQMIVLLADEGRNTTITESDNPTALSARAFRWDLARNRLTIEEVGRVQVPVP